MSSFTRRRFLRLSAAGSLLTAVGLPELITHTLEDYETLALKLAREPEFLSELRAKLARNRDTKPLFDSERYCRNLEGAYSKMFEMWRKGEAPKSFAVDKKISKRQPVSRGPPIRNDIPLSSTIKRKIS